MTQKETLQQQTNLIQQVMSGKRIPKQPHSLFENLDPLKTNCSHKNWRTIVCNGENDVVECAECGKQKVAICNFDDDFA